MRRRAFIIFVYLGMVHYEAPKTSKAKTVTSRFMLTWPWPCTIFCTEAGKGNTLSVQLWRFHVVTSTLSFPSRRVKPKEGTVLSDSHSKSNARLWRSAIAVLYPFDIIILPSPLPIFQADTSKLLLPRCRFQVVTEDEEHDTHVDEVRVVASAFSSLYRVWVG